MKFIITESKFEHVVFKYLDNQDFVKIKKKKNIYFANSIDDTRSQIEFDEIESFCYIDIELRNEISDFFSLRYLESKEIIHKWVENTLQMKVLRSYLCDNCSIPQV